MFGSAALEALERTVQARQTRQQLSGLSRVMPRPPHRHWATDGRHFQQGQARDSRVASRQPVRRPQASETGRRPPQSPKGHADDRPISFTFRPVIGYFSQRQLRYWAAHASDPGVVATLTQGYRLQFRRRPQISGQVKITIIRDLVKAQALDQELSALLPKGAIKVVDPFSICTIPWPGLGFKDNGGPSISFPARQYRRHGLLHQAGPLPSFHLLPSAYGEADLCYTGRASWSADVAYFSEVAEQFPPGCQTTQAFEAEGYVAMPPCTGPMEEQGVSVQGGP